MSVFKLGDIDPLNVQSWDGFDYPENASVTPLLGDGTSATGNALLQQGALATRTARISGTLTTAQDLTDLRSYYQNKTEVAFIDDGAASVSVYVFDLTITKVMALVYNYSCTLIEAP